MPETSRDEEIAALERKLEASRDRAGYAERVKAIEARLVELRK
jgi:hypothetical protein